MKVIAAKKIQLMVGTSTAKTVYVLKCQKQLNHLWKQQVKHPWNQQLKHPWVNVTFHTILVTAIVTMKTTMLTVDLMEVIAAKKMHLTFGTNIVMNVNV